MLTRKSGIIIPKTHPEFEYIEQDLNRSQYDFNQKLMNIKFYIDKSDHIIIPRYYPVKDEIRDENPSGVDIEIQSNIIPRNDKQSKIMDDLSKIKSGILTVNTGFGKTVISIEVICRLKKRTIIIIPKKDLLKQWVDELIKHTSLTKKDILVLNGKNHNKISTSKIILSTPHVFAINHDKEEFFNNIENAGFGLMISDECEHTGAEKFSLASLNIFVPITIGLSATPYRFQNSDILYYHLGDIIEYELDSGQTIDPIIYMVYFDFDVFNKYRKYINFGGKYSSSKYLKQLKKSEKYLNVVSSYIKKAYESNRNVLVFSSRINTILELCKKMNLPKENVGIFCPTADKKEVSKYSDTTDLKESFYKKQVVFATYSAKAGFSRDNFDALVMADPISNVTQTIGRTTRILEGKKQPIVIDLVDTGSVCIDKFNTELGKMEKIPLGIILANKRKDTYIEKNWKINVIKK